jgi:ankyrin repeat protein
MKASDQGNEKVVKLLLASGADKNVKNKVGVICAFAVIIRI